MYPTKDADKVAETSWNKTKEKKCTCTTGDHDTDGAALIPTSTKGSKCVGVPVDIHTLDCAVDGHGTYEYPTERVANDGTDATAIRDNGTVVHNETITVKEKGTMATTIDYYETFHKEMEDGRESTSLLVDVTANLK